MAIFKSLTFDGINSLGYGIYITGEAAYNAPERAVEMVNIPGKNGALALDQGRFENIEVTYHAGCFADSQADFADKVMKFRNALASRYTYKRLTDEYHSDEYRLGLYKSGLDVDAVRYGTAGEFNIVFDCKPQRFLVDGDRAISPTDWSDVQTESGELVTIDSDGSLGVKSLEVSLSPIQDLNGYDKPWVGGAGKNKYEPIGEEDYENASGVAFNGSDRTSLVNKLNTLSEGDYTISFKFKVLETVSGATSWGILLQNSVSGYFDGRQNGQHNSGEILTFTKTITITAENKGQFTHAYLYSGGGNKAKVYWYDFQLELGSTATSYEPYENICPISGRTEVETVVSPTTSATDGQTYTTTLGRTVYGGTLDVVSGVLTVDRAIVTFNGASGEQWEYYSVAQGNLFRHTQSDRESGPLINKNVLCNRFEVVDSAVRANGTLSSPNAGGEKFFDFIYDDCNSVATWKTWLASNNLQVVYPLATPQTYQLTPQQIDLLLGANHLWSDGEITVEYGVHPYYNPTPFASKPLIKVTGTGTLGIGEYILTITGTASQTLYIDCETMEIYALEGTVPTGASSLVSINKNDFPVLEPGTNYISVGSGITAVTITPRWWRI